MQNFLTKLGENYDHCVALYLNPRKPDVFFIGRAAAPVGADTGVFVLISPEGAYDGYLICNLNSVYRYEIESGYIIALEQMIHLEKTSDTPAGEWRSVCRMILQDHRVVQILGVCGRRLAYGLLLGYENRKVRFQRIFADGRSGREEVLSTAKIAGILFDSEEERKIEQLCKERSE